MIGGDEAVQHDWSGGAAAPASNPDGAWPRGRFGMVAFLASEFAFFSTLIVAYLKYEGQDRVGPTPQHSLHLGLAVLNTGFLVASSVTIAFAAKSLFAHRVGAAARWLALTVALGAAFLATTAYEWHDLIVGQGLTLRTNLFGTTYFTLIGFHAAHVTIGLIVMVMLLFMLRSPQTRAKLAEPLELTSWYWHFVDGVWIVILMLVYVLSR
ncbi:MAG: cytochrome c oxidase subunit 3 [Planctomycetia bacterium]|nr:cytochrome c oxidase subunit 3 [Planctomycetia bacterium]